MTVHGEYTIQFVNLERDQEQLSILTPPSPLKILYWCLIDERAL